MLQGGAYLNVQCVYNKFQKMLLEHVGLRLLLQTIHAYAPGAAGPRAAAPGA